MSYSGNKFEFIVNSIDYGVDGESYSLASGSLRYANHYEPNDEFDYSDNEQSMMGSVPSELGASSCTIDSMRHHGMPEVKRSTSGYEEIRIGRQPPQIKVHKVTFWLFLLCFIDYKQ